MPTTSCYITCHDVTTTRHQKKNEKTNKNKMKLKKNIIMKIKMVVMMIMMMMLIQTRTRPISFASLAPMVQAELNFLPQ